MADVVEDIRYLLALYSKLFVTCSPPITVALYIGMTQGYTAEERWETARKGLKIAAGILLATLVCGSWILGKACHFPVKLEHKAMLEIK